MQILLATKNPGKIIEIREALAGLPVDLLTLRDVAVTGDPPEDEDSFRANALQKARFTFRATGLSTLADDSGITVEALRDELGIETRRWGAGPSASDEEWIAVFLDRMRGERSKRAHFYCALAFLDADGREHVFEGSCSGTITDGLEAEYFPGLPISACFRPDGCDKVFSALSVEQKNYTSHRGRALKQFREFLSAHLQASSR